MQCSSCGTGMEKGYYWRNSWISGDYPRLWTHIYKLFYLGRKVKKVYAHRCPRCGKIEFVAEIDKINRVL